MGTRESKFRCIAQSILIIFVRFFTAAVRDETGSSAFFRSFPECVRDPELSCQTRITQFFPSFHTPYRFNTIPFFFF